MTRSAARFDNSPVSTRRRTSVHISIAAYTPCASLSVGGNRGFAAILRSGTTAQLCAAFFDRTGYPAARCTFRPAFTKAFGGELEWDRLDAKRAARVRWIQKCGYSLPDDRWREATSAQADAMVRLIKALTPLIENFAATSE